MSTSKSRSMLVAAAAALCLLFVALRALLPTVRERDVGAPDSGSAETSIAVPDVASLQQERSSVGSRQQASPASSEPGDGIELEVQKGGSVDVVARWFDDEIASEIGVVLEHENGADPVVAETDIGGRVRFVDVPPGRIAVRSDRGGVVTGKVETSKSLFLDLVVPRGNSITVTVVDSAGRPIPGAVVYASIRPLVRVGVPVGVTNELGKLALRDLERDRLIAAFAEGFVRSDTYLPSASNEISISLAEGGYEVCGTVVESESGEPVPGACVTLGRRRWPRLGTGPDPELPGHFPVTVRSNARGEFRISGVPYLDLELDAAAGALVSFERIPVTDCSLSAMRVELRHTEALIGVVRDSAGTPLSGALVTLTSDEHKTTRQAFSDSEGRFEVVRLHPGAHLLVVEAAGGRRHASAVTIPTVGAIDIVISEAGRLSGLLLGTDGSPLAQWAIESLRVQAGASGGAIATSKRLTTSDSAGRFGIQESDAIACALAVTPPGERPTFPLVPQCERQGNLLVLRFDATSGSLGSATVAMQDDIAGASPWIVQLEALETGWVASGTESGAGSVRFGLLRAGEYRLRFTNGLRVVAPDPFRVGPGDSVDLGTWTTSSIEALR